MIRKRIKISSYVLIIFGFTLGIYYLSVPIINDHVYNKHLTHKISINDDYYAAIWIPKINLKREIYQVNDKNNNLKENLLLLKESIFPGKEKSNIIIAGHSGNGNNAYFKNLYKLNVNDEVKIYYNNYIFTYNIVEIEIQNKTGELYLKEAYDNMITLITCTKNDSKTQTIYYGILKNKENMTKI